MCIFLGELHHFKMKHKSININCDLGEGGNFDAELMPLINSCNIACGGHFGNAETMKTAVGQAAENKVNIGAHPAYPDKENFGRKKMQLSPENLGEELLQQISGLQKIMEGTGQKLHHIKPHGALYNNLKTDRKEAEIVVETVKKIDRGVILFVPPQSAIEEIAQGEIPIWREGFADRNYNEDLSLVSRDSDRALITDPRKIADRIKRIQEKQEILTLNGNAIPVEFDTLCVHGDTENALNLVQEIVGYLN